MMTRPVRTACAAVLLALAAAPGVAPGTANGADVGLNDIRRLLAAGRFSDAAAAGEAEGSAQSLALAAQALGYEARCRYRGDDAQQAALFTRAGELARRATALDETDALAWRQLARARGHLLEKDRGALSHAAAVAELGAVVDALDRAKALDPADPETEMALGVVEASKLVVSREALFGLFSVMGDREAALQHFCLAARLADRSDDPVGRVVVHTAIGNSLWRLDPDLYGGSAIRHLDEALAACDGGHAVCACIHEEVAELRQSIAGAGATGTSREDAEDCPR
ncbi:MAG: hypothetical protein IPM60_00885 [Rhodospirillales bacterium]|nr:hypothetical protein [Rhodospirillales bacterium]